MVTYYKEIFTDMKVLIRMLFTAMFIILTRNGQFFTNKHLVEQIVQCNYVLLVNAIDLCGHLEKVQSY